ncbi:MAG: hypothetical protein J6I32_07235 [Bacteroidaceae bacterium]|nr:hypothetical protein [Bacteroidaceae bacterium]
MDNNQQTLTFDNAYAEIFSFEAAGGVKEYQVMIHVSDATLPFEQQLESLRGAYFNLLKDRLSDALPVFKRYFLSDASNQGPQVYVQEFDDTLGALSVIQQPPLDGTKVALWVYFMSEVQPRSLQGNNFFEARHGAYRHLWMGGMFNNEADSEAQTSILFNEYVTQLAEQDCTLADNCVRTWLFVNDIDNQYAGMVRARNAAFIIQGLTNETHFIASTGIGGRQADPKVFVQMDAYAVGGLEPGQMHYLYASDHLNRTSEYGVSFERGTCVDYGDRRHFFVSGTASINDQGKILHPGDIRKQAGRMLENVDALLKEAGATFENVAQMIVYLRDIADYAVVRKIYDERFPGKPKVFLLAPVCRPGWLIEMECMGVTNQKNEAYAPL